MSGNIFVVKLKKEGLKYVYINNIKSLKCFPNCSKNTQKLLEKCLIENKLLYNDQKLLKANKSGQKVVSNLSEMIFSISKKSKSTSKKVQKQ